MGHIQCENNFPIFFSRVLFSNNWLKWQMINHTRTHARSHARNQFQLTQSDSSTEYICLILDFNWTYTINGCMVLLLLSLLQTFVACLNVFSSMGLTFKWNRNFSRFIFIFLISIWIGCSKLDEMSTYKFSAKWLKVKMLRCSHKNDVDGVHLHCAQCVYLRSLWAPSSSFSATTQSEYEL